MRKATTYTALGIISILVVGFILWYLSERERVAVRQDRAWVRD